MTNVFFPNEKVQEDDLYFVCYMVERIARRLKQPKNYVVNDMGKDNAIESRNPVSRLGRQGSVVCLE